MAVPHADAPTWLLSRANLRAQRMLTAAFAAHGIRPLHYRALATLAELGDLSQAELGRELGLDRKDVAVTVDGLVERGLAHRTPDRVDRRRNSVGLTSAGRARLPELNAVLDGVQRDVLSPLTEEEAGALVALLARLGPSSP